MAVEGHSPQQVLAQIEAALRPLALAWRQRLVLGVANLRTG